MVITIISRNKKSLGGGSRNSIKPSSWSSFTPLTTKQEATIYKDMGGEDSIHNHIFEYIHKDLRWLIWKHPVSASKISRPNRYPLSLFFRSNFYKQFNWEANFYRSKGRLSKGVSIPLQQKGVYCLKLISDLNWNTAPLEWYVERHICTWPTCTQASTARSTFALMWARMNRCSCIYDMQFTFSKLSPIEKAMLTWLKIEVRPKLHAEAKFHGKVDTPIKRDAVGFVNGNCLWNEFMSGRERILPAEDDDDDIDKHVRWCNITKAAEFDRNNIPYEIRQNLKNRCQYLSSADSSDEEEEVSDEEDATSPSNLKASSPSHKDDSIMDIGKTFLQYKIVTETEKQGICLAYTPTSSSLNSRIALTIMGQATRLYVLQNKQESQILDNCRIMAMQLFPSTNSSSGKVNQFIKDVCSGGESIAVILHRSSTLFRFGNLFVQRQQITIETNDTTEMLATKLIEKLTYNVSTGIYVFDVQGEVNKNAIVPILLRTEEGKHYQCVAAVYRSSTGEGSIVSMRLVTRALTGVCDNCYYYSQCAVTPSSKGQPEQLKSQTPKKLSETERVFPCWMNGTFDQLLCLVFIPTSIQTTKSGSNHSLRLNHSIETIRKGWTVKDYQSFETRSHLTNVSLKTMVSDAYSYHNFGEKKNQDIYVSDTLIDELVSLNDAFLVKDISFTESIAEFSRICKNAGGIVHLLLGYKDVRKETVWLYAYFIRRKQKLVFLPCSSDPVRDILMAASTIKNYLQSILNGIDQDGISVTMMQWKQVSTSSSNSGFHVFKEFLIHASEIMKMEDKNQEHAYDYLSLYEEYAEEDFQDGKKIPKWILRNFTVRQMEQIRNTWREELLSGIQHNKIKLYELMTF